jgi:hypothetical protein
LEWVFKPLYFEAAEKFGSSEQMLWVLMNDPVHPSTSGQGVPTFVCLYSAWFFSFGERHLLDKKFLAEAERRLAFIKT